MFDLFDVVSSSIVGRFPAAAEAAGAPLSCDIEAASISASTEAKGTGTSILADQELVDQVDNKQFSKGTRAQTKYGSAVRSALYYLSFNFSREFGSKRTQHHSVIQCASFA